MKNLRLAFVLLGLTLRAGALSAAPSVVLAEAGDGMFHIEGRFAVKASSRAVWRVLSDYDRIGEFISSVDSSKLKERHPDYVLVEQTGHSGIWFTHRHFEVLLKVRETVERKIEFEDVKKTSFKFYKGSWQIESEGEITKVIYKLEVEKPPRIPLFISRSLVRQNIAKLLSETAAEINREYGHEE